MTVSEFVDHLVARGVTLIVKGAKLRIRDPQRAVTAEVLTALREHKAKLIAYLTRWHGKSIPALLAHLANHGVWIGLDEDDYPQFHFHENDDRAGVDGAVIDELHERANELVAWLQKPVKELADAELAALGYGPSVRDAEAADDVIDSLFAEGSVACPLGANAPAEEGAEPHAGRCQYSGCGVQTSAEILRRHGGYCWSCAQTRLARDDEVAS